MFELFINARKYGLRSMEVLSMANKKDLEDLKVNFVLELMQLPVDKKTNTIKVYDVNKIIDIICFYFYLVSRT